MFNGVPGVGATRFIFYVVDSVLHFHFVMVSLQFKVGVNLTLVSFYPHLNPILVDVKVVCNVADEAFQFLEVVFPYTTRGVQKENNI